MEALIRQYLDFMKQPPAMIIPIELLALAAMGLGAVFLTNGWKLFKMLVAADAVALGLFVGWRLGQHWHSMAIILIIGCGLIFAALALPLMKWAVCLMGALSGAAVGAVLWRASAQGAGYYTLANHAWAGGAIGLITMALLAFIIYRTVVVVVTSLQGALLLMSGIGTLAFRITGLDQTLSQRFEANILLIPILVLIPGILGIIFQESKFLTTQAKKRKAAMATRA